MIRRAAFWLVLVPVLVAMCGSESSAMSLEEKLKIRDQVKEMFYHAYGSYMKYAYPADELMPLSCKGRVRGVDQSRGDVDDALGKFSLTLVDTLDTLAVLGDVEEFEKASKLVIRDVKFDSDLVVSVFETNIRMVGGLLGGHVAAVALKRDGKGMAWYDGELLDMAKEIATRLLPAFNTSTGIPYPKVNLKYGIHHPESGTGSESDTCTACAGTMIMEFGALSRLTGDPIFEEKASRAMESLWRFRSRASDLVGTVINIHNGDWVRRDSGVGAGIDSYYEYCLKAYILLGNVTYLERFNKHYKSIMQYINQGAMFLSVQMHQPERTSHAYMDALQAFWPGLQVLKGDLKKAIEMHHMLYEVAKKHTFLPEAFTTDFEVHWGEHPLRPELVESTFFLYEATGDPYYLEVGKNIVNKINEHARVPCGFAALKDVRTLTHEDRMDSFVLAETFKYLFLLFSAKEDTPLHMNEFIFTTEAHLLPLSLSRVQTNKTAYQELRYNVTLNEENEHDFTCPNTGHSGDKVKYAENIRNQVLLKSQESCPTVKKTFAFSSNKPPRLRAEQFVPGKQEHLEILKSMGITVAHTKEGRIQLMHSASNAYSKSDAEDGIKFMQEMIELAKQRNDDGGASANPRVVQLMSHPYNGSIVLNAGPAQFGLDLSKGDVGVGAETVIADPIKGCTVLKNEESVKHRITVMERGECMFIDKVRIAEAAGAVAVVIIDNNDGSSSDSQPIFAMAGDGKDNDVKIPAVLLFHQEGMVLKRAISFMEDKEEILKVRVASKAVGAALKKSPSDEGDKSGIPEEKDIIDESNPQESSANKQDNNREESQASDELTEEDRELMDVIQNMKISVADLEKHSQVLTKEMLVKLQHKLLIKMKRGGDDKDINDYYEELKSKLITLKDNEVLCAATGKACGSEKSSKTTGQSTDDAAKQMNDNTSHKNNEQTEKAQETTSKSESESIPQRTGSDSTED